MKQSDICAGSFYTDSKKGLRKVLAIGHEIRTLGSDRNAVGVSYEVLMATKSSDLGTKGSMELDGFASWAKKSLSEAEAHEFVRALTAEKITNKLTHAQYQFMRTFDGDLTETESIECDRKEYRVAVACRDKGIIAMMPDQIEADDRCFNVYFSSLGLAVLACVLGKSDQVKQ